MQRKSLIDELFNGNINHTISLSFQTEVFLEASKESDKLQKELEETLNSDQKKLLKRIFDVEATKTAEIEAAAYKDGFKMGMGLTVEGLSPNDDNSKRAKFNAEFEKKYHQSDNPDDLDEE